MLFSELNLPGEILQAVERMGFSEMTEVQEKAIPEMCIRDRRSPW